MKYFSIDMKNSGSGTVAVLALDDSKDNADAMAEFATSMFDSDLNRYFKASPLDEEDFNGYRELGVESNIDQSQQMYTYLFTFMAADGREDGTTFCASSEDEAIALFDAFREEEGCDGWETIQMVYDADDADEYGALYGVPFPA